ncbi:nucleotide exchange factor GrpE [Candidatus Parcubacteria bacterium A4]|nr:MAG: nucleotide exchange factor GrpE [Candidatus Parcubacteria bacterium A4]
MDTEDKKQEKTNGEEIKEEPCYAEVTEGNKLEKCYNEKQEYLAGWQRARADFINYKKEEAERIGEMFKFANKALLFEILPVIDNFYAAEKHINEIKISDNKLKETIKGFSHIKNQLLDILKNAGVEEMNCLGEKFNPNFHDVAEEIESKDKESGTILEEIAKGYKLNGKLIRAAKIKIAK